MKEAFELIKDLLYDNNVQADQKIEGLVDDIMYIVSEVEAEYGKNIMDALLEAKKNCGEDSDCLQCVFGCEDGCHLQELQITGGNNGWIPCSERLPEEYKDVLGCDDEGNVMVVRLYTDNAFGKLWSLWNGGNWRFNCIHAWMPLPKPWKGEQG